MPRVPDGVTCIDVMTRRHHATHADRPGPGDGRLRRLRRRRRGVGGHAAATAESTQEPASSGGGETLAFSAPEDGSLKFDQSGDVTAKAGKVTVTFNNPSSVPHAVEIEGNGVESNTETVTGGEAPPVEVDLKPGTYEFYCPVGDHEAAGMKGTLTVE